MSDAPLPPLSKDQQAAVDAPFADALVTAGAGSGKTRVLSERFVHLVDGGHVPLRRLASLTFTEKAAAQMRERIADLFRRRGNERARNDVEFAPISTIHAFCALLLRQHAIEAGLDPAFQVLDGVQAELLLADAAVLAEQEIAETRQELFESYALLRGESRGALIQLLNEVRGAGCAIDALRWQSGDVDAMAAVAAVGETLAEFRVQEDEVPEASRPAFQDAIGQVDACLTAVRAGDEAAPFLAMGAHVAVPALKMIRTRAFTGSRKALTDALKALVGALVDDYGARVLLPDLQAILTLYAETYERLKREQSSLDFTDLELHARDVLQRAADTGRPLDLAPAGLLVDEFQDTNPLQAEILALLRAQAPQFSVGDPKQSIYRFRRADVTVMLDEQARIGEAACHPMNASYRACAELVDAINVVNARLFEGEKAGVVYEPLIAAATYRPSPVAPMEVAIVSGEGNAQACREQEGAWIAQRILELTDGSHERLRMDADGQSVGSLRYGDIAILVRARTPLAIYEQALQAHGIPYLTQSSVGFFQAEEIEDLIDVLRVVHNPGDRHALACLATGPAMGASSAELLRWFAGDGAPAWDRMVAEASAGSRHAHAVRTLQRVREEAVVGSLARAVEMVLHDLGLLEAAALQFGGDRRVANLRKAVEFARQLDEDGRRGLGDLLRHLETLRTREMREAEAAVGGEASDVVRLTTVHSSKGLEYPVVFVADLGYGPRAGTPTIQFDGEDAIAARVTDPLGGGVAVPGGYDTIAQRHKAESEEESLRLLYVAMTRAEERLILSGSCKGLTAKGQPKNFSGWGKALWPELGLDFEIGTHEVELASPDGAHATRVDVTLVEGAAIEVRRAADGERPRVAPQADDLEEARRLVEAADAPVPTLGDTRFVVSVSELLAFAASPPRYYTERVLGAGAQAQAHGRWDEAPVVEEGTHDVHPEMGRQEARRLDWDEPSDEDAPLDRAAIGRAVHAVLERLTQTDTLPPALVDAAVAEEGGDERLRAEVVTMGERFLASSIGQELGAALSRGDDVRREVDFHARIRFPGGEPVAGFDSLLLKGSIDLWLPTADGVRLLDHKTNRPGGRFRTAEDLAAHYAWQLRLYALAGERLLGQDIASAGLLLLDPGWGEEVVEVPIDIGGGALEEARQLCRAFAIAELEGRYPDDWRALLG